MVLLVSWGVNRVTRASIKNLLLGGVLNGTFSHDTNNIKTQLINFSFQCKGTNRKQLFYRHNSLEETAVSVVSSETVL